MSPRAAPEHYDPARPRQRAAPVVRSSMARFGRVGHRGWMIAPYDRTMSLTAWPTGFAKRSRWGMKACPKVLHWPDIDDVQGCKECVDAVLNRDQKVLDTIAARFPDVRIGFEDFLQKLRRGESTGCYARLLCAKALPRGNTLYIELIVKSRYKYIVGTIRANNRAIIAQKIYAKKKNPREAVPVVDIANPLAPSASATA
jgi:hypothetical protein